MSRRWKLDPYFEVTGRTMTDVRTIAPCGGEEWKLRRTEGVTERIADRLAVAAGLHPWNIWPDMADAAIEAVGARCNGCCVVFTPTHPSQRYCAPRCRRAAAMRRQRSTNPALAERQRELRRRYYVENRAYELAYARRRRHPDMNTTGAP